MLAQLDLWSIWCLLLVIGFGSCIGSFANVVIYRLPRNIPLGRPRWSFCPNCETSISWYDNIPVFSYFRLRGHCRRCGWAIPPRYVIIEISMLLVFLLLFDVFFVASALDGISAESWASVSYRFASDWQMYAAHVLLFGCLLAMSVIDMEHYWLDIRFTHFAALCGFVLHGTWTPARSPDWPRPGMALGMAAILATIAAIITHLVVAHLWKKRARAEQDAEPEPEATAVSDEAGEPQAVRIYLGRKSLRPSAWLAALVLLATLVPLVWAIAQHSPEVGLSSAAGVRVDDKDSHRQPDAAFAKRAAPGLLFVFCALIAGSVIKRDSDDEIEESLEAERHNARKVVLKEFAVLLPSIVIFAAGLLLAWEGGPLEDAFSGLWNWTVGRQTRPILGLGTAAAGFIIGGAVGWCVRIFFTLVLGKEAYGVGDIHIMAAAGAVAGWEVVVVGFFLSSLLALVGKLLTLPFKRGHALPMGPWLTLAMFLVVLWRGTMMERVIDRFGFAWSFFFSA